MSPSVPYISENIPLQFVFCSCNIPVKAFLHLYLFSYNADRKHNIHIREVLIKTDGAGLL